MDIGMRDVKCDNLPQWCCDGECNRGNDDSQTSVLGAAVGDLWIHNRPWVSEISWFRSPCRYRSLQMLMCLIWNSIIFAYSLYASPCITLDYLWYLVQCKCNVNNSIFYCLGNDDKKKKSMHRHNFPFPSVFSVCSTEFIDAEPFR